MLEADAKPSPPWPSYQVRRSYAPHIWDNWLSRNSAAPVPDNSVDTVVVKNILGESIVMDPTRRHVKNDWEDKILTEDCTTCPFYIPRADTLKLLQASGKARVESSIETKGLCTFGVSGKFHLRKLLLESTKSAIGPCQIPIGDREKRLTLKRELGNFFV